jgi:hypothetical protein
MCDHEDGVAEAARRRQQRRQHMGPHAADAKQTSNLNSCLWPAQVIENV